MRYLTAEAVIRWNTNPEQRRPGWVGTYLSSLTPEQEDRLLTRTFEPTNSDVRKVLDLPVRHSAAYGTDMHPHGARCLVMTVADVDSWGAAYGSLNSPAMFAGLHYEDLCQRFGVERTNRAIRNRVLRNIARRGAPVPQEVAA